jgi:hypothetical protein
LRLSKARIEAVSMDMSPAYWSAVLEHLPEAAIVFDRFRFFSAGFVLKDIGPCGCFRQNDQWIKPMTRLFRFVRKVRVLNNRLFP